MITRTIDPSPFTIRPKRVFWITDGVSASYLDMKLAQGQGVDFISPVQGGVFVITDGMVPVSQNDSDHRGREDDAATCEDVVAASGASVGSPGSQLPLREVIHRTWECQEELSAFCKDAEARFAMHVREVANKAFQLGVKTACSFALQLPPERLSDYRSSEAFWDDVERRRQSNPR